MADKARLLQEKYVDEDTDKSVIINILATTGGRGGVSNQGGVRFEIIPPEQRTSTISANDLAREWRKLIGPIPGAESVTFRSEIGRTSSPIDVQLSGTSLNTLKEVADLVKQRLATYPTVFDIADSLSDGKQELQIELTQQGVALGLTRMEVSNQIRNAFFWCASSACSKGSR